LPSDTQNPEPRQFVVDFPKHYLCYRATSPITIDGRLDDAAWQDAPWTDDFVDIEGDAKPRPRFRTRAKMLWDDDYLYIGAEMEEPNVWATLTEHDSVIFHDNDFEVFIDPDGDNHNYYEIELNAFGTEWDLLLIKPYRDGGPPLNSWEIPGLKLATHVDGVINDPIAGSRGWSVELAIPWNVLAEYANRPAPPNGGDQWRINFSRVEWDIDVVDGKYYKIPNVPEHNWVWTPQGAIDMHRPERWGFLQFTCLPPGTSKFRPDPYFPIRDWLMQAYHAQVAYRAEHGDWADSLAALSLPPAPTEVDSCTASNLWKDLPSAHVVGEPVVKIMPPGYEIQVDCRIGNGPLVHLHVRDDSRLWAD
jgi:hypothetical protein